MSASLYELQRPVDELLELLGIRIRAGQIVIHIAEARVQKVETNLVYRARSRRDEPIDNGGDPDV